MATPQPQQPSQPVYQRDLGIILDRVHNKFVDYANAKDEALASQMRVGFAEAYNRDMEAYQRDEALLKRVESVETGMQSVANTTLALAERVSILTERVTVIETTQQTIIQLIQTLHAQVMESINDLRPKDNQ
ncbi:MAG: hypothetical protein H0X24_08130 [Ktedonobacterales bacterium]|nr:hypothetical protein [Ktedonobacterales bacterium]